MKQETKVVAIILAALIVFLGGFGLGATKGITVNINGGAAVQTGGTQTVAPVEQTTVAPPAAEQTTAPAEQTTVAPPAEEQTTAPAADNSGASSGSVTVPQTKAEIAAAYNKVVNEAKHYEGKVTLKKHDIINVALPESAASKILNPIIANLTKTSPEEYVFDGGKDVNDANRLVSHKIVPNGRDVAVEEAGLASASATANADGGYTMTITFIPETSTFDGTNTTSEPTHHKTAMDPLDLGSLKLDPVKITNADMRYPGATMTATVDGQGRLVKLEQKLPLEGSGTGKAGISLTLEITGSMDGTYEFIYG